LVSAKSANGLKCYECQKGEPCVENGQNGVEQDCSASDDRFEELAEAFFPADKQDEINTAKDAGLDSCQKTTLTAKGQNQMTFRTCFATKVKDVMEWTKPSVEGCGEHEVTLTKAYGGLAQGTKVKAVTCVCNGDKCNGGGHAQMPKAGEEKKKKNGAQATLPGLIFLVMTTMSSVVLSKLL